MPRIVLDGLANNGRSQGTLAVVALWNTGRVVAVPTGGAVRSQPLLTGFGNPQHLLVDGAALLVADHATGTIWRVHTDG